MKYSDLVDLVLAKLNLTADEAKYDRILTKIPSLCNEALGDIANRGKPFYKTLIFDLYQVNAGETVDPAKLITGESVSGSRFITFPSNFISLTNEFIQRAAITLKTDGEFEEQSGYEIVDGHFFRALSSRQILFPNDFGYRYLVPTFCRYPTITGEEGNAAIDIEESVVELLPNYVVSELLRVDDVTLSAVYRNLYESSLAALNDSILAPTSTLINKGW